jgi:hypothetical protein
MCLRKFAAFVQHVNPLPRVLPASNHFTLRSQLEGRAMPKLKIHRDNLPTTPTEELRVAAQKEHDDLLRKNVFEDVNSDYLEQTPLPLMWVTTHRPLAIGEVIEVKALAEAAIENNKDELPAEVVASQRLAKNDINSPCSRKASIQSLSIDIEVLKSRVDTLFPNAGFQERTRRADIISERTRQIPGSPNHKRG